jgi:hypothetical protein
MKISANKKGQIYDEIARQMYALRQHLNDMARINTGVTLPMSYITQKIVELETPLAQAVIEIVEGKKST